MQRGPDCSYISLFLVFSHQRGRKKVGFIDSSWRSTVGFRSWITLRNLIKTLSPPGYHLCLRVLLTSHFRTSRVGWACETEVLARARAVPLSHAPLTQVVCLQFAVVSEKGGKTEENDKFSPSLYMLEVSAGGGGSTILAKLGKRISCIFRKCLDL